MAGEQPTEKSSTPGAFPETPAANDDKTFSVNPIPASEGASNPIQLAPGEKVPDPSTVNDNTVTSAVHDDPELKSKDQEEEQTVGVAPIPATGGIGNPVQLQPGEKVPDPSTITGNTVDSTAKKDKESYEKSDASTPVMPAWLRERQGEESSTSKIPESGGLPAGEGASNTADQDIGPTMSSVGPESTTAALAGQVPKEQRGVPEVVEESQKEAKGDPEASANPDAVEEKKETEEQLKKEVPEEKPTMESGEPDKSEKSEGDAAGMAAGGVAAAGTAAAGTAVVANETVTDKTGKDPASALPASAQDTMNQKAEEQDAPTKTDAPATDGEDSARETTAAVPQEVTESQKEAGQDAEAAAHPEAVKEKSAMEKELLSEVKESNAKGEPAPTESAAAATTAPAATSSTGAPQLADPTAGVAPISMDDKPSDQPSAEHVNKLAEESKAMDDRDVSPMSKPAVTTGIASATAPTESTATPRNNGPSSSTPQKRQPNIDKLKDTPESTKTGGSSATDGKKEKRRSFFGKIKDKLKS